MTKCRARKTGANLAQEIAEPASRAKAALNEAVSLQVYCDTQEEVDYYWERLSKGGDARVQQCGWLKDKYGLSWQIVPTVLPEMMKDHESAKAQRAMEAVLRMKKIDIAELERAFAG